ncbi:MAG: hypothetical protein ACTSWY_08015 [Promethearchaeota archaeon]
MVNIGVLGAVSAGKTSLLRLFVKYNANNSNNRIADIEGGNTCRLIKTDFTGESTLQIDKEKEKKSSKTIHPNRVYFRINNINHTLFAPGGDRERAVVRMGIITISRIAKQIIVLFSLDRSLSEQFEFFNSIRYFPKEIYACYNKIDLLNVDDRNYFTEDLKNRVTDYFSRRKVRIRNFFFTCAEIADERYKEYNDNAADMILKIATDHKAGAGLNNITGNITPITSIPIKNLT